jgi:flavodoxin
MRSAVSIRQLRNKEEFFMAKNLIIYYSRKGQNYVNGSIRSLEKGNSELIAEFVQNAVGGDLFEIETVRDYSGDYMTCTEEAKEELRQKARPELKNYLTDISKYDNVFVLGPCWWGTYPMAMYTQLEKLDFTGRKVFLMMTHEGSGMGGSEREMKMVCKGAEFGKSLAVYGGSAPSSEQQAAAWAKL